MHVSFVPVCFAWAFESRSDSLLYTYYIDTRLVMAPKHDLSLLFHPKKPAKKPATPVSTPKRKPVEQSKAKADDEDEEVLELPTEPYSEFRLLSSAMNGWKYDVMKFDSRKPVDISRWQQPIKLNRKDVRRDDRESTIVPVAVGPMLGSDGKPVIGADGKIVLVDAEGRPIRSDSGLGGKDKGKAVQPKKRFQKKTRQVFLVPEETRLLRKEERFPWVLEDSSPSKNEVWMGALEDVTKAETHAFFMPAANDVFKFVPAHRWYKFQKKLGHALPTDTATVDAMVCSFHACLSDASLTVLAVQPVPEKGLCTVWCE